nr:MAG TPA: hypothetical protein [Caudoviricetes sp.]
MVQTARHRTRRRPRACGGAPARPCAYARVRMCARVRTCTYI